MSLPAPLKKGAKKEIAEDSKRAAHGSEGDTATDCASKSTQSPAEPAESPLCVGGIDYLNALPLTLYLPLQGNPTLHLSNHVPSVLADRLRSGELDIALVPAVEYLAREEYRILPGICISSYGEVRSIRLFHRCPLNEAQTVGLDRSSRTSALLTRLFFHDLWKGTPKFIEVSPEDAQAFLCSREIPPDQAAELPDAVLLIGDIALNSFSHPGWECLDLGVEWTRWTGLPFVYAFWVWRGGSWPAGLAERFLEGKNQGLARVDDIVRRISLPGGLDASSARHYLSRVIQYDFAPAQVEGCLEFYSRLWKAGLIPSPPRPLSFLGKEQPS